MCLHSPGQCPPHHCQAGPRNFFFFLNPMETPYGLCGRTHIDPRWKGGWGESLPDGLILHCFRERKQPLESDRRSSFLNTQAFHCHAWKGRPQEKTTKVGEEHTGAKSNDVWLVLFLTGQTLHSSLVLFSLGLEGAEHVAVGVTGASCPQQAPRPGSVYCGQISSWAESRQDKV